MKTNGTRPVRRRTGIPLNRLTELRLRGKRTGGTWLTTAEVAKLRGVSEGWVSLQENSKRPLTDDDVEAYAKIYKVPPHRIFKGLTVKKTA